MSTVAEEITRISGCREDIKTAIAAKGVTVPTGAKLADCPALIASITGGGGGEATSFISDSYTATGIYEYSIPFTAEQNTAGGTAAESSAFSTTGNTGAFMAGNQVWAIELPSALINDFSYGATLEINLTPMYGQSFNTTAGTVYYSTASGDPNAISIGSWRQPQMGTGGILTATINSLPAATTQRVYMGFRVTDQTPWFASSDNMTAYYTATATSGPHYPQYDLTTTGVLNSRVEISGGWSDSAGGKVVELDRTANSSGTYLSGPSYTTGPYIESVPREIPFKTDDFSASAAQAAPSLIEDQYYLYTYGTPSSGYTGYTGI